MTCAKCDIPLADDAKFCSQCGTPTAAQEVAREARKNLTILFVDVVGSTTLGEMFDPEALDQILNRYFAAASSCIKAHGGATEKFIGDAVMAVFGAEVSHEDDALRAVRAALDTLTKVSELNVGLMASHRVRLEVRIGIGSGEVMLRIMVNGDFKATGDANNVAARLQTSAKPGQILIDPVTASLVKNSVMLEPAGLLELKGKKEPVPSWRVTGLKVPKDLISDASAVPLIGREDDLEDLQAAYRRVIKRSQLNLVTVIGAPGIGKSRLVRDFVSDLMPSGITVLTGRCSAYGKGITFKPLAEMLDGSGGGWTKLTQLMETGSDDARRATDCLSGIVLYNPDVPVEPTGVEEISWSVRYLLAQLGRTSPVVMIWEDLHWAEPTLLDMIDHVVNWLTDVPVMLICVSRPDLLETRPAWGGGKPSALTMEVNPLSPAQCAELVAELAGREEVTAHQQESICERVAAECEGNPLFAELMLDLLAETTPGARVPPTISALLTARLDQLPVDDRRLLEIAAVIGRDFTGDALAALLAVEDLPVKQPEEILTRLVRRRILIGVSSDSYRFGQQLMHDNAYQLSPKSQRERRHQLLAERLARLISDGDAGSSGQEQLALVDHVEAACLLSRELRPGGTDLPDLAPQAAAILISEGTKALHRMDYGGAATLLDRGRGLVAADDERQIQLMLYISDCRLALLEPTRALEELPRQHPDPRVDIMARIQRSVIELQIGSAGPDAIVKVADQIETELLAGTGANDRAWCRLYLLKALVDLKVERTADADAKLKLALERARALRDEYEEDRLLTAICEVAQWSPIDVESGLRLCAQMSERFATNRAMLVPVLLTKARLAAVGGDLMQARAALAEAAAHTSDLHLQVDAADVFMLAITALVDSLAGDHKIAAAGYRRARDLLLEMGRAPDAVVYVAYAARELFDQGALTDAEQALQQLTSGAVELDPRTVVLATSLRARLAACAGQLRQAVELAASSAAMSEQADDLCLQGNTYLDLAIVARQAGQLELAERAATTAIDRYQAKGASGLIRRARNLMGTVSGA